MQNSRCTAHKRTEKIAGSGIFASGKVRRLCIGSGIAGVSRALLGVPPSRSNAQAIAPFGSRDEAIGERRWLRPRRSRSPFQLIRKRIAPEKRFDSSHSL